MSLLSEHLSANDGEDLRADLAIIAEWIKADSKVLDLGCGDGTLLAYLRELLATFDTSGEVC